MTITETEHDQSHIGEAAADATATADGARDPLGELLHVDPRDLIVGANDRGEVQFDRAFLQRRRRRCGPPDRLRRA